MQSGQSHGRFGQRGQREIQGKGERENRSHVPSFAIGLDARGVNAARMEASSLRSWDPLAQLVTRKPRCRQCRSVTLDACDAAGLLERGSRRRGPPGRGEAPKETRHYRELWKERRRQLQLWLEST